jgi:hypothetical protein
MIDLKTNQNSVIKEPGIDFSEDNPILFKAIVSCDQLAKEQPEEQQQQQPGQDGLESLPSLPPLSIRSFCSFSSSEEEEVMFIDSHIEIMPTALVAVDETGSSYCSSTELSELGFEHNIATTPIQQSSASFLTFRLNYLVVTLVIGLANGLQGMKNLFCYQRHFLGGGSVLFEN